MKEEISLRFIILQTKFGYALLQYHSPKTGWHEVKRAGHTLDSIVEYLNGQRAYILDEGVIPEEDLNWD